MSSTTTTPTATITNNLGFDVDIYDVFNPDTTKPGPLTYTFVVTVPNGASAQQVQTIRRYSQLQAMPMDFRTALGDKTSQEDAVNKFFQGTGSFKLCILSTWIAVFGWQTQFTSPWQGTYYLNSLDNENTGVVMAGNGSMQEKDPGLGNISLALAPAWLNVA
ncbi:hypothetical protein FOC1_g10000525 [Fusarium oxysporum f. sp. cubense race 1]|uniref:Uncharacterized protein n=1 Tax=Fusarium oxysporum f. sp. cubense (strain race 1) TaxID=1229664 RepID=N4UCZ4_FUSC1|nr:hypothetical protein FOC1_g10000525 [Fusarium oxysporum f. sp. cubense race 1]